MHKQVNYGEDVNKKFLNGISKLSEVVGSTLGARGRNVAINERGRVHCTKDGITVANNFELTDPIENMGASLVREASARTNSECGDGSTGSIILTSAQGVGKHLKHFPPIMIVVAFESQIQDSYKQTLEQLSETTPQWLLSIKTGELIEEEIRELYMFVISG
jgi:chaperonin GroEL